MMRQTMRANPLLFTDVTIKSRFAQLEYRAGGDVERGKTLFEQILQSHPKLADIWNVFADFSLKYEGPRQVTSAIGPSICSL